MENGINVHSTTVFLPVISAGPNADLSLIQSTLDNIKDFNAHCVIVTRSEKKDLLGWIRTYQNAHSMISIEPYLITCANVWAEALLKTKSVWSQHNLVAFPEIVHKARLSFKDVLLKLQEFDVVYGVVESASPMPAVIGFKKVAGDAILQAQLNSAQDHEIKHLTISSSTLRLAELSDRIREEVAP